MRIILIIVMPQMEKVTMPKSLNGWQRIWVVLSVVYLLVVIAVSAPIISRGIPTIAKLQKTYAIELIALLDKYDPDYKSLTPEAKRIVSEKVSADYKALSKLSDNFKDNKKFSELEEKYRSDISNISRLHTHYLARSIFFSLMIWLIPISTVYAIGLSAGWIMRGFSGH